MQEAVEVEAQEFSFAVNNTAVLVHIQEVCINITSGIYADAVNLCAVINTAFGIAVFNNICRFNGVCRNLFDVRLTGVRPDRRNTVRQEDYDSLSACSFIKRVIGKNVLCHIKTEICRSSTFCLNPFSAEYACNMRIELAVYAYRHKGILIGLCRCFVIPDGNIIRCRKNRCIRRFDGASVIVNR